MFKSKKNPDDEYRDIIKICYQIIGLIDGNRDLKTELSSSKNISKLKGNMCLALIQGNFYPSIVLMDSKTIPNGFKVFCIHTGEEYEVAENNVIGNFKSLLNLEVSFYLDGIVQTGFVAAIDDKDSCIPMNFFICNGKDYFWTSLPNIFLTWDQAKVLS